MSQMAKCDHYTNEPTYIKRDTCTCITFLQVHAQELVDLVDVNTSITVHFTKIVVMLHCKMLNPNIILGRCSVHSIYMYHEKHLEYLCLQK